MQRDKRFEESKGWISYSEPVQAAQTPVEMAMLQEIHYECPHPLTEHVSVSLQINHLQDESLLSVKMLL